MTPTEISERFAALEARAEKSEDKAQADRARLTNSEGRLAKSERKLRVTWAVSALAAITLFTMGWHKDAIAQGYGMTLAQAATRIAALETKTASMGVVSATDTSNTSGKPTVRFTGVNVQIVDGTGATEGTQSGVGNLIVGYNELRPPSSFSTNDRTGNHNIIAGIYNNYSGSGGTVFGYQNDIGGSAATVTGGRENKATGSQASVSGGQNNTASGSYASVSGGLYNTVNGNGSSVSGGAFNTASYYYSSVSGGVGNTASNYAASVSGGGYNTANMEAASVSGGKGNVASNLYSSVSGGSGNTASGWYSAVSGGSSNSAPYQNSSVSGGRALTPLESGSNGGADAPWCAGGGAGGNGVYRAPY